MPTLRWEKVNSVTWKLTNGEMTNPGRLGEGRTTKALAWVIDVGWVAKVSLWLARYKDQACGPMSLSEAKAAARAMVRGEPADYTVTNPIAHLHGLQSRLVDLNPEADEPPAPRAKPKGFPVRLYLEDEAPTIGCGYRKVIWQFRGKKVVLHHGDYTQAIKRATFKELIASNKRYRSRNRRPALKLVVNNPKPPQSFVEAA